MTPQLSRRTLLSTVTMGGVAGCVSDGSTNVSGMGGDQNDECDIETGEWYGAGEPTEITVEEERSDHLDIEYQCAENAAEAAFLEMNTRHDIDLESRGWISYGPAYDGDHYAWIRVAEVRDHEGNLLHCPDPEFDPSEAREKVPAEVTVTLHLDGENESHECNHQIKFDVRQIHDD